MIRSSISRLDLLAFIEKFASFFAREKDKDLHAILMLPGDRQFFSTLLQELDLVELKPLPKLAELDTPLIHLQKQGTLSLNEIFSFSQLVGYFIYLKKHIADFTLHTSVVR